VKKELQLKYLKKINAQELTADDKQARMTRAQQLLNKYPNLTVNFMFLLTKSYSPLLSRPTHRTIVFTSFRVPEKKNVNENRLLRTRSTFSKSVGGRSTDGVLCAGIDASPARSLTAYL